MKYMLSALLLACALLPAALLGGCAAQPEETPPAEETLTQEQIDGAQKGEVCCPHCGRWSTFSILSEELPPWDMF